ncbi:MAG: DUF4157 domain-containing protein [Cyanobacteria bacterium J06554_6]
MASRDRNPKQPTSAQNKSTTLPQTRPFADQSTQAETAVASKSTASFSFSDVSVVPSAAGRGQPIQPKLTIGEPGDKYEEEADKVAKQVVQRIHSPQVSQGEADVQRMAAPRVSRLPIQRQSHIPVGHASNEFEQSLSQARSGGNTMEPNVQAQMESAMGADFSRVKVHTDAHADQLSRSIQAKAFTTGNDVFFKQGAYNPGSRGGQELLAHELTHVVQQNGVQCQPIQRVTAAEKEELMGIESTQDKPMQQVDGQGRVTPMMANGWEIAFTEFRPLVEDIAKQMGDNVTVKVGAMKGQERALFKTEYKYDGDSENLVDLVRGTLVCADVSDVIATFKVVKQRANVLRVKNRFAQPMDGYRDIMVNVEMSNGHVAEIQISMQAMQDAKDKRVDGKESGHDLYKKVRVLEVKKDKEGLTAEEEQELNELKTKMTELYNQAWEEATAIS